MEFNEKVRHALLLVGSTKKYLSRKDILNCRATCKDFYFVFNEALMNYTRLIGNIDKGEKLKDFVSIFKNQKFGKCPIQEFHFDYRLIDPKESFKLDNIKLFLKAIKVNRFASAFGMKLLKIFYDEVLQVISANNENIESISFIAIKGDLQNNSKVNSDPNLNMSRIPICPNLNLYRLISLGEETCYNLLSKMLQLSLHGREFNLSFGLIKIDKMEWWKLVNLDQVLNFYLENPPKNLKILRLISPHQCHAKGAMTEDEVKKLIKIVKNLYLKSLELPNIHPNTSEKVLRELFEVLSPTLEVLNLPTYHPRINLPKMENLLELNDAYLPNLNGSLGNLLKNVPKVKSLNFFNSSDQEQDPGLPENDAYFPEIYQNTNYSHIQEITASNGFYKLKNNNEIHRFSGYFPNLTKLIIGSKSNDVPLIFMHLNKLKYLDLSVGCINDNLLTGIPEGDLDFENDPIEIRTSKIKALGKEEPSFSVYGIHCLKDLEFFKISSKCPNGKISDASMFIALQYVPKLHKLLMDKSAVSNLSLSLLAKKFAELRYVDFGAVHNKDFKKGCVKTLWKTKKQLFITYKRPNKKEFSYINC